ncbi:type II toxin-antitoxin system prevent-host-death family antitoxin [Candidatus Saccharibacteria bacterium]|nr:type II toxin-antitoxin system prevent-host-death family antitoxin [Candidatus Saccharibacteria bacterium]
MKLNLKTVKASEFKAKCLKLMDQVASSGQELIITKNQKPVAKLTPYRQRPKTLFGIDKGKIEITGDIVGPVEVDWKARAERGWDDLA